MTTEKLFLVFMTVKVWLNMDFSAAVSFYWRLLITLTLRSDY